MTSSVHAGVEVEVTAGKLLKKRQLVEIYGEGNEGLMIEGIVMRPGEGRKWVVFWDIPRPGGLESEHGANFWTVKQQGASDTQNLAVNDESDRMSIATEDGDGDDEVPDDDVDHDPAQAAGPTDVQDHYLTTNGMSCKVEQNGMMLDKHTIAGGVPVASALHWQNNDSAHHGAARELQHAIASLHYFLLMMPHVQFQTCLTPQKLFSCPHGAQLGMGRFCTSLVFCSSWICTHRRCAVWLCLTVVT